MIHRLAYTTQDMIPPDSSESDGFDFPNGNTNTRHLRLRHFECGGKYPSYPFRFLVQLYARLGLHRYNLLEGKYLQLDSLQSFNMSVTGGPSSYYLSLVARVPDSGLQQPFQVFVQERSFGFLDLGCPIARPLVTTKEAFLRPHSDPLPPPDGMFFSKKLPRWPSSFTDANRFHLVKESELQDNDWIRLYLELALVYLDRSLTHDHHSHHLSQLEIVQAAIETTQDDSEKTTVVYITYNDLAMAQVGEPLQRRAIVRRIISETTGNLRLRGVYWIGDKDSVHIRRPSKRLKLRLGVHRLWRLSNPRCHQLYKTRRLPNV